MARNRGIKNAYFKDLKVSMLDKWARTLPPGMWTEADDSGVLRGETRLIKSQVFPYDDDLSIEEVEGQLVKMCVLKFIILLVKDGERYFSVRNWIKHQQVNHPSRFRFINDGEEAIMYIPGKGADSCRTIEELMESSVSAKVKITYEGKNKHEIDIQECVVEDVEKCNFPDPKNDREYAQYILDTKMGKLCPICNREFSLNKDDAQDTMPVIDHIRPRSKGGSHGPSNLQVICAKCNTQKYNSENGDSENYSSSHVGLRPCGSTKEKIKENNNIKKEKNIKEGFQEFWNNWLREHMTSKHKNEAFEIFEGFALLGVDVDLILEAQRVANIKFSEFSDSENKYIPLPKNWLSEEPWRDLKPNQKAWKLQVPNFPDDQISAEEARIIAENKNLK